MLLCSVYHLLLLSAASQQGTDLKQREAAAASTAAAEAGQTAAESRPNFLPALLPPLPFFIAAAGTSLGYVSLGSNKE